MDLQTAQAKLDNGLYANRQEFVRDIKLIVSNCLLYNGPKSEMGMEGKRFEKVFTNREFISASPVPGLRAPDG